MELIEIITATSIIAALISVAATLSSFIKHKSIREVLFKKTVDVIDTQIELQHTHIRDALTLQIIALHKQRELLESLPLEKMRGVKHDSEEIRKLLASVYGEAKLIELRAKKARNHAVSNATST